MKKIISFLAYFWAAMGTFIILALFIGFGVWQKQVLKLPFMQIDPIYSGGAITDSISIDCLKIYIHEPVFPGIVRQNDEGFIQIDIKAADNNSLEIDSLPINGEITSIKLTTEHAEAAGFEISRHTRTRDGWIVRFKIMSDTKISQ